MTGRRSDDRGEKEGLTGRNATEGGVEGRKGRTGGVSKGLSGKEEGEKMKRN